MPHIIIEHSVDHRTLIRNHEFTDEFLQILADNSDFDVAAIKFRSMCFEHSIAQDVEGRTVGFIHVRIHMLSGRSLKQRSALATAAGEFLKHTVHQQGIRSSVTVEILEITKESYFKYSD